MTDGETGIAVMSNGIIQQLTSPLPVNHPRSKNLSTAFIGSPAMNFVPVRILQRVIVLCVASSFVVTLPPAQGGARQDLSAPL